MKHSSMLAILLSIIILTSCATTKSTNENNFLNLYPPENTVVQYHTEWTINHYREKIKEFQANPVKKGDIVFLGNSITEGGKDWSQKLNVTNAKNRGISGDVTDGVLLRLGEITYNGPSVVFILIGVNDLFNMHYQKQIPSEKYVAENIIKIAANIYEFSPRTKIYVQTILPTANDFMKEKILSVNEIISQNKGHKIYEIINLHAAFADENDLMKKSLTSDGTHLNENGYALWVEIIKKHLAVNK